MVNINDIYDWPIHKIESEFALISRGLSDLSANKRQAVKDLYIDRLEKGLLTKQKLLVSESMERINKAVYSILEDIAKTHAQIDPDPALMRKFTIAIMPPQGDYIADYYVFFCGEKIGKIIVDFEKCKFYENGQEPNSTTTD